ncbi:MAG: hypothetical protein J2P23_04380 [Microlunatus sp.]|nr:hypothetical protein [Microlunatus sp.]
MPEVQGQSPCAETELRRLCSALHLDAPIVRRFIGDYLRLLQCRLDRIEHDLGSGDIPSAIVGLLSLSSSSTMLGATGVADAAEQLRRNVSSGNIADVAEGRTLLAAQASTARVSLARIESAGAAC